MYPGMRAGQVYDVRLYVRGFIRPLQITCRERTDMSDLETARDTHFKERLEMLPPLRKKLFQDWIQEELNAAQALQVLCWVHSSACARARARVCVCVCVGRFIMTTCFCKRQTTGDANIEGRHHIQEENVATATRSRRRGRSSATEKSDRGLSQRARTTASS